MPLGQLYEKLAGLNEGSRVARLHNNQFYGEAVAPVAAKVRAADVNSDLPSLASVGVQTERRTQYPMLTDLSKERLNSAVIACSFNQEQPVNSASQEPEEGPVLRPMGSGLFKNNGSLDQYNHMAFVEEVSNTETHFKNISPLPKELENLALSLRSSSVEK